MKLNINYESKTLRDEDVEDPFQVNFWFSAKNDLPTEEVCEFLNLGDGLKDFSCETDSLLFAMWNHDGFGCARSTDAKVNALISFCLVLEEKALIDTDPVSFLNSAYDVIDGYDEDDTAIVKDFILKAFKDYGDESDGDSTVAWSDDDADSTDKKVRQFVRAFLRLNSVEVESPPPSPTPKESTTPFSEKVSDQALFDAFDAKVLEDARKIQAACREHNPAEMERACQSVTVERYGTDLRGVWRCILEVPCLADSDRRAWDCAKLLLRSCLETGVFASNKICDDVVITQPQKVLEAEAKAGDFEDYELL